MSNVDKSHLDSIEENADVTDTENVHQALGITPTGATDSVLSQRGVFVPQLGGGTINITGDNLNVQLTELNQLVPPLAIAVIDNETAYLNTSDAAISANINSTFPSSSWLNVSGGGGGGAVLMTADLQEVPSGGIAVINQNEQYYNTLETTEANTSTDFTQSRWVRVGKEALPVVYENNQTISIGGARANVAGEGMTNAVHRLYLRDLSYTFIAVGEAHTWSYDPDTSNSVYTQSFSGPWGDFETNSSSEILTDIAEAASAVDGITWDGVVYNGNDEYFNRPVLSYSAAGIQSDYVTLPGWSVARYYEDGLSDIESEKLIGDINDDELRLNSLGTTNSEGGTHLFGLPIGIDGPEYSVGDTLTLTFSGGVTQTRTIAEVHTHDQRYEWISFEVILGFGGPVVGYDETLVVSGGGGDFTSKYVEIDLGVMEELQPEFELTNPPGGYSSLAVSFDGYEGAGIPSTVTVSYGDESLTSFNSSVSSPELTNIDEVGMNIANAINSSSQNPSDYKAIYNALTKSVHSFSTLSFEQDSSVFAVSLDNNDQTENSGNLTFTTTSTPREFVYLERTAFGTEVYAGSLPSSDPQRSGRIYSDAGTLKVSGETQIIPTLISISISNLTFTGVSEVATISINGVVGTSFSLSVVSTTPTGWLTAGSLGATSGVIPAAGVFETTLSIPEAQLTGTRTAAIRAINSSDTTNIVTTGLFTQSHTAPAGDGDLTASSGFVIIGTTLTFSTTVTAGDPNFTIELFDSDPEEGTPTALQTETLTALGIHTFTDIDTSEFEDGDHNYWIKVSDADGDVLVEMETITITTSIYDDFRLESYAGKTFSSFATILSRVPIEGKNPEDIVVSYNSVDMNFRLLSNQNLSTIWDISPGFDDSPSAAYTITDTGVSPNVVIESGQMTLSSEHVNVSSDAFYIGVPYLSFTSGSGGQYRARTGSSSNTDSSFAAAHQLATNDTFTSGVIEFTTVSSNGSNGDLFESIPASSVSAGDYFFRSSYTDSTGTKHSRTREITIT